MLNDCIPQGTLSSRSRRRHAATARPAPHRAPLPPPGILEYGGSLPRLKETMSVLIQQLRASSRTSLLSVVFEGAAGAGKTALAAHMALTSTFPFVRLIAPATTLGEREAAAAASVDSASPRRVPCA